MTTYDKYCPGKNCKKRDECAMHQFSNICTNFPSLADWSQENFGQYECGDNGNYQYFIPKETPDLTDKQIVEDFLHFLSSKKGIINTGNYTYSYQELRNALISYHKETAAAYDYAIVLKCPEKISEISKEQIEQFKKELNEAQYMIYGKCGMPKQEITFNHRGGETEDNMIVRDKDDVRYE